MADTVQKIKERLTIVDVIQPYVKLTKAGKYWKGLSPFTKEKTPSFYVSPDRGLYHCFSSGKGGDMFTFVEELERVDFKGALRILAEKAGVEIEKTDPRAKDERERMFAVLEAATKHFEKNLKDSPATEYLITRGVSDASIAFWRIGYSKNDWQDLTNALTKSGFTLQELERAGLAKRPDASDASGAPRLYDRFRGRIMFPIRDASGRVIAFSGRIYEDDPKHPQAKYLNSPQTDVFDKSRALYGLYEARDSLRSLNASLLVEGQMDLVMAHQAGYRNAIATSGTAFTENHAETLKRHAPNIVIVYDGDRAGIAAAGRAAAITLKLGMNTKIAALPPGMDPADTLLKEPQTFKDAVRASRHVIEFYLSLLKDAKYDPRTFKLEVSRTVLPYISMIDNRIERAHFVRFVSEELNVPGTAVEDELQKLAVRKDDVKDVAASQPFLTRGDALIRLVRGVGAVFHERGLSDLEKDAIRALQDAGSDVDFGTLPPDALIEADLFLERFTDDEDRARELTALYGELKRVSLHEKYRELLAYLKRAEKDGNDEASKKLMQELTLLAKELR